LAALFLLPSLAVQAGTITPTLVFPNSATNDTADLGKRPVADGYALRAIYTDDSGNNQEVFTGAVYGPGPASLTLGKPGSTYSTSTVTANPASFDATSKSYTYSGGGEANFTFGSAQTWNWYVVTGDPGTVSLTADIVVQGSLYANRPADDGYAVAIFGQSLGFLSNPLDETLDYAMVFNGTIGWDAGLVRYNTVTVGNEQTTLGKGTYLHWDTSAAVQSVNYIIRSQPFEVTVGTPFRLSLISSTQTFAGEQDDPAGTISEAWADFTDPRLVTSLDFGDISGLTPSGFSVVLPNGGGYADPVTQGLTIRAVPEPPAAVLLLTGLMGLLGLRRGRKVVA
jgi:hypothetical protein